MSVFSFEKLDVWQKGQELVDMIYNDTNTFPDSEKFSLVSQIRRSSISFCSNIAEGSGKTSFNDKNRFISIAYGSLMETMNLIILSNRREFINNERTLEYRKIISRISVMLVRLSKYFTEPNLTEPNRT